jgi:hypothetical protein
MILRASLRPAAPLLTMLALLAATVPVHAAQDKDKDKDTDERATVHVNAIKNPELHTYRAIAAGLDKFDQLHALAPAVPQLRFQVEGRGGKALAGELPTARISADDFSIPLTLDQDARFSVPRSQAAYDAKAELILNRKKQEARVVSYVRTPGLADNQVRLGDVRLDCQVKIAIVKEEMPFWINGLVNSLLLTTDWCSWFKGETPNGGDRVWSQNAVAELSAATMRDGERSMALKVKGKGYSMPIGDASWSNDALIEFEFAPPAAAVATAGAEESKGSAP